MYHFIKDAIIMKIKNCINIALIIIWLFVIFSFSAQDSKKSRNTSDQVIIKTAETIKREELTENEKKLLIDKYLVTVRKSAHFFLYFILGILSFLLAKRICGNTPAAFIYTIIFCFIYACSDEIHQLFINGRTARFFDICVDTCGATLSTTILFTVNKIKNRFKKV